MCSRQSVGSGDDLHGSIHHGGPANPNRAAVPIARTSMPKLFGRCPYPLAGHKELAAPYTKPTMLPKQSWTRWTGSWGISFKPLCWQQILWRGDLQKWVLERETRLWQNFAPTKNIGQQTRVHGIHEVPPATSISILFLKLSCHLFRVPDFHC